MCVLWLTVLLWKGVVVFSPIGRIRGTVQVARQLSDGIQTKKRSSGREMVHHVFEKLELSVLVVGLAGISKIIFLLLTPSEGAPLALRREITVV